jgi:epoxyqueuosine reductase
MKDEFYEKRVQPILYNYLKEKKYFQRNAAIALGNLKDPAYIPDLEIAMNDSQELVRSYAAWALGRIGGQSAKKILQENKSREISVSVKNEIEMALVQEENGIV